MGIVVTTLAALEGAVQKLLHDSNSISQTAFEKARLFCRNQMVRMARHYIKSCQIRSVKALPLTTTQARVLWME